MKTKITFILIICAALLTSLLLRPEKESEIDKLRKKHVEFLEAHPFNQTLKLSKGERKNMAMPPNKYFEQESLMEINPATGRTEPEKLFALQEALKDQVFEKNVPGTSNNAWVERGPNNVPGRTRAMLFDPNDATGKRVFAGGVSGGLWVNNDITNSNSSWSQVGIPENLTVSSITADPNNPMIMYLGTGESYVQGRVVGNGIFKSTNGGNSWTKVFGINPGTPFFNGGSVLTINSPAGIAGDISGVAAIFGPGFNADITGNLVLVDDGSGAPSLGCGPLTNGSVINGNIAVIERGTCNFTVKVKNAQNQGATAVVMINNVGGNPIPMGGTDATITIPSLMISQAEGATILSTMETQTVNATVGDDGSNLPGATLVPGVFYVNDIVSRNNGGNTEIYAAVSDGIYREAPGTLLGQGTEYGLYRSTNAGGSWTKLTLPLTANGNPHNPNDIEIGPDNKVWLSTTSSSSYGDGGGVIFSSTNGTSFSEEYDVPGAFRTEIEVSATNANKIYVLAETGDVVFLLTTDGFATTPTTLTPPDDTANIVPPEDFTNGQAFYDLMLEADPTNDAIVYVGGINTHRSTNSGTSWSQISRFYSGGSNNVPTVHPDIHEMFFDPANPNKAVIATDGGVYYANSLSAAESSTSAIFSSGNDYNTTQYYKGAIGQNASSDLLVAGSQDNGSHLINGGTSGINAGIQVSGGDGTYCFFDKDGEYFITSSQFSNYFRLNLPYPSGSAVLDDDDDAGAFINQADLDDNLDILYTNGTTATSIQIGRITNVKSGTASKSNFNNPLLTSSPTVLKVSPFTTTSTTMLIGTLTGSLLKVTGAQIVFPTPAWTDISGPEFVGSISDINFGMNENEIYVTFHNYGVKSIWYTTDGGANWQNKEGDFPDIPVKAIQVNPLLTDEVIIGTDLGVWRTSNFSAASPNWVQSQNGMKDVKVTSFDLRTADNTILATTYGRGMFTGKFTSQPLSVEEISADDDRITVFPNPTNGNLNIRSTLDFGSSKLSIFDLNGRQVYSKEQNLTGSAQVNLSNLTRGIYVLNIRGEKYNYNRKIILQ